MHSSLPRFLPSGARSFVFAAVFLGTLSLFHSTLAIGQLAPETLTLLGTHRLVPLALSDQSIELDRRGPSGPRDATRLADVADLPEAPGSASSLSVSADPAPELSGDLAAGDPRVAAGQAGRTLSPYDNVVDVGTIAPPQTARDKVISSLRTSVAPFSLAGSVVAGSYSHLVNGSPNYGTNSAAFGERVGAAIARGTSQTLFSNGVMAPLLHEDFRYYQLGPQHPLFHRVGYAITRPLISRTDSGKATPNLALLSGYLGAAFLTRTYYPEKNQSVSEVMQTYGSSLGGAALGYAVHEFFPDLLAAVHLKKND